MDQSIIRISKELGEIQKTTDLSLAVACRDVDVRNVRALIIGPHETPYEFGFFEFAVRFNSDYPSKSPAVLCVTTNGGRCRFNPNIYADGKVCLSILGTWRGERGEQWSSAQGLESILLSIQSLMSMNPYENEPGYEHCRTERDRTMQVAYTKKIRHETLRITIIQRLEEYLGLRPDGSKIEQLTSSSETEDEDAEEEIPPFEPFKDLCKQRFLWYYESYIAAVKKSRSEVSPEEKFTQMPFESTRNGMIGSFHFQDLEKRLERIKAALDEETESWAPEGLRVLALENRVAINLKHQFGQVWTYLQGGDMPHDLALENENPFVWVLTYFGRPMTNFDSGLLRIKIRFSPRFPEEQPRVKLETKIFHHLVAQDGTLCYTPNPTRKEDVKTHLDAVLKALEEDEPAYDPRKLINLEACRLFWNGGPENKKLYHRKLRRSVQDSLE